ncbi:hypothetical protein BH10PSE7_BH10PSE7_44650 [soil metagenome]
MLRRVGAWDPFNVTEDADLGVRLARFGYRSDVIDSGTREEACSELGNWLHQRSRWLKGWLQTWHVHMREPRRLWRELGPRSFIALQVLMVGILVSALLHPVFALYTVWCFAAGVFFPKTISVYSVALAGIHLAVFTAGYFAAMLCAGIAIRREEDGHWLFSVLTMPFYWMLMAPAAWIAVWQFFREPFVWNKTRHGDSKADLEELRDISWQPALSGRPRQEPSRETGGFFARSGGFPGRAGDSSIQSSR